jgi:serine/threonine-protein kinase HipA
VVLQAQILFWLIGATDGHAKNFSLFLGPGGRYSLTPLYDILTAEPSMDAKQIERRRFRLAMCVGKNPHYLLHEIVGRHFVQTGEAAGLSRKAVLDSIAFIADNAEKALASVEQSLTAGGVPARYT